LNRAQKSPGTLEMLKNGAVNRLATVFFYLTDVEAGGETGFPRAHGGPQPVRFFLYSSGSLLQFLKSSLLLIFEQLPSARL